MKQAATTELELPVQGMTCASCANRIERRLNTLDGVEATVNYATERASVRFDAAEVVPERLVEAVEAAGYTAELPRPEGTGADDDEPGASERELSGLRQRLIVSAALSLPILLMSMIPALQFAYWQWLTLQ